MRKSFSPITCFSLFFLFLFFLFSNSLQAAELSFGWSPNTEPNLAGYKIYYGTASRTYSMSIDVGNPPIIDGKVTRTLTIFPREETLYYFSATAYDVNGFESDYSTEVVVEISPETSNTEAVFLFITEGFPQEDISAVEETALLKVWQVQKLSRDLYQSFNEAWSSQIYENMSSDSQYHMDFVHILLGKFGIPVPQDLAGIFTDQEIQNLFDLMLNAGNGSAVEALRMGAAAEDMIIDELQTLLVQTDNHEILIIYQNLLKSARNHLRLFVNELAQIGINYDPQYISGDDFLAIIATPTETGIYDENGNVIFENREWLVTASQNGLNQVDLTWTDPTPLIDAATLCDPANEIVYRIMRSINDGGYTFLADVLSTASSYSDTTVVDGNNYQYRVYAVNVAVEADSIGVFNAARWSLDGNGNSVWDNSIVDFRYRFGLTSDKPIVGDWDGDGRSEIAIYRDGSWYFDANGNGIWDGESIDKLVRTFIDPIAGDIPVAGDWNADGVTEIGIYRPLNGNWFLDINGNEIWDGKIIDRKFIFGIAEVNDVPVVGNWTGCGGDKIGLYRSGKWLLDTNGNGILDGKTIDTRFDSFPAKLGDIPVVGDWDGGGRDKIGFFRSGTWVLDKNGNGLWDSTPADSIIKNFMGLLDIPVVGKW